MNGADDYCLLQMRNKSRIMPLMQSSEVDVFIRLVNNKSIKMKMPSIIEVDRIKEIVAKHLLIPIKSQIVYIKGEALSANRVIYLQPKTIIHVTNTDLMEEEELHIFVIKHQNSSSGKNKEILIIQECKTAKRTVILQFLERLLANASEKYDIKATKAIQSGRFLSVDKTFEEEKIEMGTQIHLILQPKKSSIKEHQQNLHAKIEFQQIIMRRSRQNSLAQNKNIIIPLPTSNQSQFNHNQNSHQNQFNQNNHNHTPFHQHKQEINMIKMTKKVKSASPLMKSQSHEVLKKPPQLTKLAQIHTHTKQSISSDRSIDSCPQHPYQKIKKYQVPAIKKQCVRVCNCKPKRKAHGMLDQMMITVNQKKPINPEQRPNSGKKMTNSSSLNSKIKNKLIKV